MRILATAFSIALLASAGFAAAQTNAPAPAAPAATAPAPTMAKPAKPAMSATDKAAKSKECSTQADAKGLHGKARKDFREKCKHGA